MSNSLSTKPGAASRFFDNYIICLNNAGIHKDQRPWYVKRLEGFIKLQNGRRIKSLSGKDITEYFEAIGRKSRLSGWQFYQCIDAIRILYCNLLISSSCQEVDWNFWLDSAKQLEIDHPTTARQLTPEELSFIKPRKGKSTLNQVRASHRDLLVLFTSEIRRRGYAYRTEQSYEQWVCRFILFCDGVSPGIAGKDKIKEFLDYLAIQRCVTSSTQNQALNALVFLFEKVLGPTTRGINSK